MGRHRFILPGQKKPCSICRYFTPTDDAGGGQCFRHNLGIFMCCGHCKYFKRNVEK